MKMLVTGATGFLGQFLCEALEKEGHELVKLSSKDADLTQTGVLSAYDDTKFDRIFHLAAWTQAGDFALKHSGEQWIINQQMNTNVLTWWHEHQPQAKLIAMGTSCSYDPELPLVEENYMKGEPIESLFTYAQTKRMLYAGQLAFQKQFGHSYLTLVPSTLYGPQYHTDGRQMHFIFDLIRKILRGKLFGEEVVLWGNGHQKRELIYVRDFVTCLLKLSDTVNNDIVNVGGGEEHSIRDFAERISTIVGYDPALIKYDTSRYVGAKSKVLDIAKLKKIIPDLTLTTLDEGLTKTIEWFEAQPDYAEKH